MENIIKAFAMAYSKFPELNKKPIKDIEWDNFSARECLCNIQNKLLSLPDDKARIYYARIISKCLNEEYSIFLDWAYMEEYKGYTNEIESMAEIFVMQVISIFRCFDINLEDILSLQPCANDINYKEMAERSVLLGCGVHYLKSNINRISKRNEFTLYRKKEAIITLLESLGINTNGFGSISSAQIQRFIYFLIGNGTIEDDIRNTYVADVFKPGKDTRNNNTINKDLDFVAARFDEIGLFDLAQKVRNGKI